MTVQTIKIGDAEIQIERKGPDSIRMRTEERGRISILEMTNGQCATLGDILKLVGRDLAAG